MYSISYLSVSYSYEAATVSLDSRRWLRLQLRLRRRMSPRRTEVEKEKETERPVNFFEQISWSPAMPKFMTSLPKLESQKQRKRTEEQRKGSAKAFFRWSCGDAITLIEFWQLPHKSLTNCPCLIPFSLRITGRKWDVVVLLESMSKKARSSLSLLWTVNVKIRRRHST